MPFEYSTLLAFFSQDFHALKHLPKGMSLINKQLVFGLADLHAELAPASDYLAFRKALYASCLNADLAKQGLTIEVYKAAPVVDDSLYGLKRAV